MWKALSIKSIILLWYLLCGTLPTQANHTPEIICEMNFFIKGNESKSSGIRTVSSYPYPRSSYVDYSHLSTADFKQIFSQQTNEYTILRNYSLYVFPQFIAYARTLPSYNDFMLSLHTKITHDKTFRKSTVCIPGFEYSFGLFHEKSGFHDFVCSEALTIHTMQQQFAPKVKECKNLITVFTAKKELCFDNGMRERLTQRINALEQTCKQQNTSSIDNQLHAELSGVFYTINRLERSFPNNHYVQTIAPVISRYAEQAKTVQSLAKAFELSDFCYTVTQVLTQGVTAIGKGVYKSAQTFVTPEHWRDMATGAVQLGMLCIATLGEEEGLRYRMMLAYMSQDSDAQERVAQHYCEHTQAQKDAVSTCAQQTYEKIKAMPWQEVVENGAEIGTSMILDTLALHALSGFSRAASGSLIKQLNNALESGAIFTEQYAVEVAGFGKLIVQEGPEVALKAIDIIKNEPALLCCEGKIGAQVIEEAGIVEQFTNKTATGLTEIEIAWKPTDFAAGKLQKHFDKHVVKKGEWGANISMTIDEYLNKAKNLLNSEVNNYIHGFISKEGWVFRYNQVTNELAIAKPDGIIETLFCPTEGMNYWMEQVRRYK